MDGLHASSEVGWDHVLTGKKKFRVAKVHSQMITVYAGTTRTTRYLIDIKCRYPS